MITLKIHTKFDRANKKETYSFTVDTVGKTYAHCKNIMNKGYWRKDGSDKSVWYPPHSITKVDVSGTGINKGYTDTDDTNNT